MYSQWGCYLLWGEQKLVFGGCKNPSLLLGVSSDVDVVPKQIHSVSVTLKFHWGVAVMIREKQVRNSSNEKLAEKR